MPADVTLTAADTGYTIQRGDELIGYIVSNGCYLTQIELYPEYRGNGYGKAAIEAFIERCRQRGAETIETSTVVSAELETILIDHGFERISPEENCWKLSLSD